MLFSIEIDISSLLIEEFATADVITVAATNVFQALKEIRDYFTKEVVMETQWRDLSLKEEFHNSMCHF